MRAYATNNRISVYAIAGTHVVLLGLNATDEAKAGLLGFTIEKKGSRGGFRALRGGARVFENHDTDRWIDSRTAPIQSMIWGDYTAEAGKTYSFRVTPVYGAPGALELGDGVEFEAKTERQDDGEHAVYFNRGVAGSQAYTRRFRDYLKYYPTEVGFGDRKRTVAKPYIKPEDVPERDAYTWLSRGLEEGMMDFIAQAKDERWSLRAAVYEFTWRPALQAFADAIDRGADVKVVHHAKNKSEYVLKFDRTAGVTTTSTWADGSQPDAIFENRYGLRLRGPDDQAEAAIDAFMGVGVSNPERYDALASMLIPRTNAQISHNKFIILLKDGVPEQVWTGSTNITGGGIFGQSNVGHVVRNQDVAKQYLDYWTLLAGDPKSRDSKTFVSAQQADLTGPPPVGITCIFSPRETKSMLEWYAERMAAARHGVFFTTAFTVAEEILNVVRRDAPVSAATPYQRYLLMEGDGGLLRDKIPIIRQCCQNSIAWGDVLKSRDDGSGASLELEVLTGLNEHVNFLHTKYMLIDPLSDDPLVVSGSANFSESSTTKNDENMLVIRGDTRVADIFLGEFMRLFNHFKSRNVRNEITDEDFEASTFLRSDDSWLEPYYTPGTAAWNERLLFAGPGRALNVA